MRRFDPVAVVKFSFAMEADGRVLARLGVLEAI